MLRQFDQWVPANKIKVPSEDLEKQWIPPLVKNFIFFFANRNSSKTVKLLIKNHGVLTVPLIDGDQQVKSRGEHRTSGGFRGTFLWCYVRFVLLRFRLNAFVEAAALRSIVLWYAGAPIATRVSFFYFFPFFFVHLEMWLFQSIFYFLYHFRFLFVLESMVHRTLLWNTFRMVFFYLVTTGWIFDISLLFIMWELNQSIKSTESVSPLTEILNSKKGQGRSARFCAVW